MSYDFDEEASRKAYGKSYGGKHPIPTIQGYREHRAELKDRLQDTEDAQNEEDEQDDSRLRRAVDSVKTIAKDEDKTKSSHDPYPTANRNAADRPTGEDTGKDRLYKQDDASGQDDGNAEQNGGQGGKSATETAAARVDPKQKRKDMKKIKRTGGGREVTDPVTHLPVVIHDSTGKDLSTAPENEPDPGTQTRSLTGLSGASKSRDQLHQETGDIHAYHMGLQKMFPPPHFQDTKHEMMKIYRVAMLFGLVTVLGISIIAMLLSSVVTSQSRFTSTSATSWLGSPKTTDARSFPWLAIFVIIVLTAGLSLAVILATSGWLEKKIDDVFEDEVWDAARQEEVEVNQSEKELPESVAWLNSLLSSVWPLINPDLFASLVDTLEDVMQASLPKVVRMVSVDDLGQGSESIRILGIRWLPTGAAGQSVDADGNLASHGNQPNDRNVRGEGETDHGSENKSNANGTEKTSQSEGEKGNASKQDPQTTNEGMEAEEGDFVNVELAFAYRARSSGKSIRSKAKNAHLYLKFYLPGGIAVPVWVELRGIIGTMRMRLQLTPDPPFFSLCTLTFLGQPKANLSCVPLSKHSLNLMDVPLISSFVQSAIDAALAEYVAPKSLTLDLKDMLVGDDFKKDTATRGVVLVFLKQARDFKEGDGGIGPTSGSSDSYVTLSWGKFGKPVASTRIIEGDQQPNWHEWHSILVSPEELNADENLRVQIWDSDKWTADDDLGRVEVDLKELMKSSKTRNKMCDRQDDLHGEDPEEKMPGIFSWSVGYFSKLRIQQEQLDKQTVNTELRTKEDLKKHVSIMAQQKLREATIKDESRELSQQKAEDLKELEDLMIASAPPLHDHVSGIFSIQIHNITGLEISKQNKEENSGGEDQEDGAEHAENLPDSYCTIMLNHMKVYRTRTKPKNSQPFFNAGTERFIRDWTNAEVMVSVRDNRERENDPLLGMVYLPLWKVFEKRSQTAETYPLAGGMGHGRIRISMVWRSVELQMPKELTGWDYGTLEIKAPVRVKSGSDAMDGLKTHRIKLHTKLGKAKMDPKDSGNGGEWWPRRKTDDGSVFLAVRRRYQSALVVEFRRSSLMTDSTPAFAIFWLYEIPDEEEKTVSVRVWKGGKKNLQRAESCCDYQGLEQDEQALGEVAVTLRFWRGLSGYHKRFAQKARTSELRDVMECLDTVADEKMEHNYDMHEQDSAASDSDSSSDMDVEGVAAAQDEEATETARKRKKLRKLRTTDTSDDEFSDDDGKPPVKAVKNAPSKLKDKMLSLVDVHKEGEDDGSRGLRAQAQDYKDHHKQLHRKHRGIMQWRGARTMDWMMGKAKRAKGRVEEVFEHSDKGQGIETEV